MCTEFRTTEFSGLPNLTKTLLLTLINIALFPNTYANICIWLSSNGAFPPVDAFIVYLM